MKSYDHLFNLNNKKVYVVGGAGLLGSETCKVLASRGATVIALDVNDRRGKVLEKWATSNKVKISYVYFDVTDLERTSELIGQLFKKYGLADVWINASYPRSRDWAKPVEDMTLSYLRENVEKHLNTYLWTSREVALRMKAARKRGSIIHFGSIYGVVANDLSVYEGTAMTGELTYCAIKGGIANMTRYMASHFGGDGIRVNCVCPGGIFDHQNPKFVKNYERKTPLKRMGTAVDIAGAVVFLASDAAQYVTGSVLMVDGGWTAV